MTPEARDKIRNHRGDLEDLADSELPCSWIADQLLEAIAAEVEV